MSYWINLQAVLKEFEKNTHLDEPGQTSETSGASETSVMDGYRY